MPQHQKSDVRRAFVQVAGELFAERGFAAASLREVVSRAGGSLGNLRNYFPSKDALFAAACEPVPDDVTRALAELDVTAIPESLDELLRHDRAAVQAVAAYIVEHRRGLRLLLTASHGSSLERWRDELFEAYVELELKRLEAFVQHRPGWVRRLPSRRMVFALCQMYFGLATDFVADRVSEAEFWAAVEEFDAFRHAGFAVYLEERP